ncbi:MAG: glycan-binding surface protein [Prevotellaceae bacterium]|jgi:hypothetical protein|nr:glycan-binding surface protein [Prevotellaceae bacterium]
MKTLNKILFLLYFMIITVFHYSCVDSKDSIGGPPKLNIITSLDRNVPITSGNLTDWVILHGENLINVTQVLFNNVPTTLEEAYLIENEITIRIPRVVPSEINNLVTVINKNGESSSISFQVNIPEMIITGIYNEFTPAGQPMEIIGDLFDLYEVTPEKATILFGNQEVPIISSTATSVIFNVPQNATEGTIIKIKAETGEVECPVRYKERGLIITDFDPYTGWAGGDRVIQGPVPEPISGNYLRFNQPINVWSFYEFIAIGVNYEDDMFIYPERYNFKFEINTGKPITRTFIGFGFGGGKEYRWFPAASGQALNSYGKWQTITLDLEVMLPDGGALPGAGKMMQVFFYPDTGQDEDIDLSFDNLRIVLKR